ncbi:MAG: Nif3-like dinuclear metal center hexameric protein [Chloroflexota bacterium]
MTSLATVTDHLDGVLRTREVTDYPNALNGLQISNEIGVRKIAAAVDCSLQTIGVAAQLGASLLVVHHGMFWGGLQRLQGTYYRRVRSLIINDIALYASHLPLDAHPTLGNNVLLARQLGLEAAAPFAQGRSVPIGIQGTTDIATLDVLTRAQAFAAMHGGVARISTVAPDRRTYRWAICTGAGASTETLREAAVSGVDTLIVGEGPHHTAVEAADADIVIIYAGHYATETLGVQALAKNLSTTFDIPWFFIEAPTGL